MLAWAWSGPAFPRDHSHGTPRHADSPLTRILFGPVRGYSTNAETDSCEEEKKISSAGEEGLRKIRID